MPLVHAALGNAIEQAPVVVSQQAVGCGHVCAEQVEAPLVAGIVPDGHKAPGSTTKHAPVVVLQQAVGCGQGCGEQVVMDSIATLPAWQHCSGPTVVHAPLIVLQHTLAVSSLTLSDGVNSWSALSDETSGRTAKPAYRSPSFSRTRRTWVTSTDTVVAVGNDTV